jgi:hypothetical protein
MSLKALYQELMLNTYNSLSEAVKEQGVETELCGDGQKFISAESRNLYIDGKKIAFFNENICIDSNGLQYNTAIFETNGELEALINEIDSIVEDYDDSDASLPQDIIDEMNKYVFIRGYETEEDLDAQRSSDIETITLDEWDSGKGTKIIEDNEDSFYHIEVSNSEGRILNQ